MAAEDLVSAAEARSALVLGAEDVSLQDELARLITSASRLIDTHFGAMVAREVTEKHDPPRNGLYLQLRQSPISSITSVTVDGVAVDSSGYQIVEGGYGEFLARVSGYTPVWWQSARLQGITVVYQAGRYATTSVVPSIVKDACVVQLRHMWRPTQYGAGTVNEYDTAAVATDTAGLARGLKGMLAEFYRHGAA